MTLTHQWRGVPIKTVRANEKRQLFIFAVAFIYLFLLRDTNRFTGNRMVTDNIRKSFSRYVGENKCSERSITAAIECSHINTYTNCRY